MTTGSFAQTKSAASFSAVFTMPKRTSFRRWATMDSSFERGASLAVAWRFVTGVFQLPSSGGSRLIADRAARRCAQRWAFPGRSFFARRAHTPSALWHIEHRHEITLAARKRSPSQRDAPWREYAGTPDVAHINDSELDWLSPGRAPSIMRSQSGIDADIRPEHWTENRHRLTTESSSGRLFGHEIQAARSAKFSICVVRATTSPLSRSSPFR